MLANQLNIELVKSLVQSGGGLVYSNRGKPTISCIDKPIFRLVVSRNMTDIIRDTMNSENIIYLLISEDTLQGKEYFPDKYFENTEYVGRPYLYGLFDCFTLVKDWFSREKNVNLPWNLDRPFKWWDTEASIYLKEYTKVGFRDTTELNPGSGFFSKMGGSTVANHAGIYLGNNTILHHPAGRFSCIEPITVPILNSITNIVEYKGYT